MTRGRYRWTLAVVAVSAFMITLDNTVVNNAMHSIITELHMSETTAQWVATGYIVMFSCLMIAGGRLTDVYGARVTFITGMAIFTSASLAAGLSHSDTALILSRIVQGSGAALALPATYTIVTVGRSDKQRSIGNIVWIAASSISLASGPPIGGFITHHFGWNWIFLLNVVPGIVVMLLAMVVVNGRRDTGRGNIDLPGVLISATTMFALTYAMSVGERLKSWTDPAVLSVTALALIAAASFVLVERWAPDPMINLQFFRNKAFSGGTIAQMLWGMGFTGVLFHGSQLMQNYLGFSEPLAGLVFVPPSITLFLLTPVAFWLAARFGSRMTVAAGMVLMATGMALFGTVRQGDRFIDLMPGVMLVGAGSALVVPIGMYVLKTVPDKRVGVASGIINVSREISGAFGIAVMGVLIVTTKDAAIAEGVAGGEAQRQGASVGLFVGAALVLIGGLVSGLTLPGREPEKAPAKQPATKQPAEQPVPVTAAEPELVTAGAGARTAGGQSPGGPGYGPGYDPSAGPEQSRRRRRPILAEPATTMAASAGGDGAFESDEPWWLEDSAPRQMSSPYHSFDWYTPRNSQGQYEAR